MNTAEILITIFVFGIAMSFLVAKGIWEARDYHRRELERTHRQQPRSSPRQIQEALLTQAVKT